MYGLFDPVSLLRTLSEAELAKRGEDGGDAAAGSATPVAAPPADQGATAEKTAFERAIMTPNVYGTRNAGSAAASIAHPPS